MNNSSSVLGVVGVSNDYLEKIEVPLQTADSGEFISSFLLFNQKPSRQLAIRRISPTSPFPYRHNLHCAFLNIYFTSKPFIVAKRLINHILSNLIQPPTLPSFIRSSPWPVIISRLESSCGATAQQWVNSS
jgi:hypothetical protein